MFPVLTFALPDTISRFWLALATCAAGVLVIWALRRLRIYRLNRLRRGFCPLPLALPHDIPPLTPAQAIDRYVRHPARFAAADSVRLLVNGDHAYPEMLHAVAHARRRVNLETYILADDPVGRQFQNALIAAARRGVRVRLVYDWIGSLGLDDTFVRQLVDAGVHVSVYHPLVLTRPSWAVNRRTHRKLLIIDGDVAFTGGLNISNDYASAAQGGKGWRDTHVRLDGRQVAAQLNRLFEDDFRRSTPYAKAIRPHTRLSSGIRRRWQSAFRHSRLEPRRLSTIPAAPTQAVKILGNQEFKHRHRIREAYLHAILHAQHYILIENAYFIPDARVRRALADAAARGVIVAVMLPQNNDVLAAECAARHLYSELLASGIRLFEWPLGMMHAKTAVIDDAWALVGSYNFDHRSLRHQLEAVAVIADPAFARSLRQQMLDDIHASQEITPAIHALRPWHLRLIEPAAYLVRHLL